VHLLVDTFIDCDWLLRRFRAIETQLYERILDVYDVTLGQVFSEHTDEFTRLQRRIDSTQRHNHNALNQLRRLQAEETAHASAPDPQLEPAPDLVSPQNQTTKPQNGFVPQTPPADPPSAPADSNSGPSERPPAR
jgi:hypothetical protein